MKLQHKLMALSGLTYVLSVTLLGWGLFYQGKQAIFSEFQYRGTELVQTVARLIDPLFESEDLAEVLSVIRSVEDANDVVSVSVHKANGEHWVETSGMSFPEETKASIFTKGRSHRVFMSDGKEFSEFRTIVGAGPETMKGSIRLLMNRSLIQKTIHNFQIKLFLLSCGVFALGMLLMHWALRYALMIFPRLMEVTKHISEGNYSQRIEVKNSDELGRLAESINVMSQKIAFAHNELNVYSEFPKLNPAPVLRVDHEGTVLLANPSAKIFFNRDRLQGLCLNKVAPEVQGLNLKDLCRSGGRKEIEIERDGRIYCFVFCGLPAYQIIHGYSFDITELKGKDRQLVQSGKLAALGEMSAGIAHELNNPLHFIKGFNGRIKAKFSKKNSVIFEDVSQYIEKVDENCQRMIRIINHFREFSRQAEHSMNPISINSVLESSFVLFTEQLRLHNISVKKNFCAEKLFVMGDPNRLEQVFVNLISNARDALEGRDSALLTVSSHNDRGDVVIVVEDNGPGIDTDVLEKIFNPFFTTKDVGKGTGLGLSISHGIITEHGGSIQCSSQPGHGTKFEIVLALHQENEVVDEAG